MTQKQNKGWHIQRTKKNVSMPQSIEYSEYGEYKWKEMGTGKLNRFRSWRIRYAVLKASTFILDTQLKSFEKETNVITFSIYEAGSGYVMKNGTLKWETRGRDSDQGQ